MRQVGVIAGRGGLYALNHHRERLAEDHANARAAGRAAGRRARRFGIDLAQACETNVVVVEVAAAARRGGARGRGARAAGVLDRRRSPPHRLRLVTHLDVDRGGVRARGRRCWPSWRDRVRRP
jgi:threonine aldolase